MSSNPKILALALGLGLTASTAALAQGTSAPAGTPAAATGKIGIVGIQEAIAATNEGKKEMEALQQRFAGKQAEIKALNDEVEGLKKQLQAQGDKLSDDARANSVKTLEAKQKTLQRNYEDYQNEVQQAEQDVLNRLGGKMLNVMEKYASANGYSLILDVSNPQTTPVLWASAPSNITQALVDAYNAQSPVAAPAAKPAGSAGAATNRPA
ncbi:MAG TPA: OmpH family outer membrane protein, partial [Candidatus Angelobacter sp.]|nr:OmpH family outer membrane protein [Candidatus Angelobacter sp.]